MSISTIMSSRRILFRKGGNGGNQQDQDQDEKESLLNPGHEEDEDEVSFQMGTNNHPAKIKSDWDASNKRTSPQGQTLCAEIDFPPDTTLASLALRYNVPLAELKRVNNILSEKEIFAHSKVKIPVMPDSYRSELLGQQTGIKRGASGVDEQQQQWITDDLVQVEQNMALNSSPVLSESSETAEVFLSNRTSPQEQQANKAASVGNASSHQARKARKLLRAMDRDLEGIRKKNEALLTRSRSRTGDLDMVDDLLLGGRGSLMSNSRNPASSRALCICCLFAVIAVICVILWYARHHFIDIENHHHHHVLEKNGTETSSDPPQEQSIVH